MARVEQVSEDRSYLENLEDLERNPNSFLNEYEKECLKQAKALEKIGKLEDTLCEEAHRYLFLKEGENFKYKPTEVLEIIETISQEEE